LAICKKAVSIADPTGNGEAAQILAPHEG